MLMSCATTFDFYQVRLAYQEEVDLANDGVFEVVFGFVIFKFYVQAIFYANLHLHS